MICLVKLTNEEKRALFQRGLIDSKGNVRLDALDKVEEILKHKEEKFKQSFDKLKLVKMSQQLLGIRIGDCRVIAIFRDEVYVNCFGHIQTVSLDYVLSYIKSVRYVER